VQRIGLSPGTWIALVLAFLVLVALLAGTMLTLVSQRQRTVELNHQLGALVGEATYVLDRARPALGAVPQSTTIRSRAKAASQLVDAARPLVGALSASGLPDTVNAAGQLIAGLSASGLPRTVSSAGHLIDSLDRPNGLSGTLGDLDALLTQVRNEQLVPRASQAIDILEQLLRTQQRTLRIQEETLDTSRGTQSLTAQALAATRQTLLIAQQTLQAAQQTLSHAASLDRKVGPVP
jgi:hypothetical protein